MKRFFIAFLMLSLTACAKATPTPYKFSVAQVTSIKISDYPILPEVDARMRDVYQAGLKQGNRSGVFSKFGDCMTANRYFLAPFSQGNANLSKYENLKEVIAFFASTPARSEKWKDDSFATQSLTANNGFNAAGPLNPTWADPTWCANGENPMECELRIAKPSIALIMFGTNDVQFTEPDNFDSYLRTLITKLLEENIVPLISTFPTRPENPEKSLLLNQIVIKIATEYKIPLLNLNRALEPLPNHGVNPQDTLHLTVPEDEVTNDFSEKYLQYGFTLRNLVTLQALDKVWRAIK